MLTYKYIQNIHVLSNISFDKRQTEKRPLRLAIGARGPTNEVCCSVLQCVAVCCRVLHCVAVCCSVLQCVAVCCSVLQCVAVCCSVLQCVIRDMHRP